MFKDELDKIKIEKKKKEEKAEEKSDLKTDEVEESKKTEGTGNKETGKLIEQSKSREVKKEKAPEISDKKPIEKTKKKEAEKEPVKEDFELLEEIDLIVSPDQILKAEEEKLLSKKKSIIKNKGIVRRIPLLGKVAKNNVPLKIELQKLRKEGKFKTSKENVDLDLKRLRKIVNNKRVLEETDGKDENERKEKIYNSILNNIERTFPTQVFNKKLSKDNINQKE